MGKPWRCSEPDCDEKAIIKMGRGKTARYFCKKHELVAVGIMLSEGRQHHSEEEK